MSVFVYDMPHTNCLCCFVQLFCCHYVLEHGVHGSAVGWGTALQAVRSRVRFPMVSLDFFHWRNPSGRTVALGSTQPLTEISTRDKGGRCVGLKTLPASCWSINILEPLRPVTAYVCLALHLLLTLRVLIQVFVCFWRANPQWARASSFIMYLDHTQRRTLLTSDQIVAETFSWQHTTFKSDRQTCPRWDSNPQSQQASGCRPTPSTPRPLGPAC